MQSFVTCLSVVVAIHPSSLIIGYCCVHQKTVGGSSVLSSCLVLYFSSEKTQRTERENLKNILQEEKNEEGCFTAVVNVIINLAPLACMHARQIYV